ncbi:MAG: GAF domain-containing sensor histidine kinase [Nitrospinota bacterium]|nr:GAF domain-containing sensor histidine kinase [Nitrospinota bacterium]
MKSTTPQDTLGTIAREYQVLHEVARALQSSEETITMLKQVMKILIQFEELKVESKAGIFLADEEKKVLRLFTTVGSFTQEFLEREKEVPYGDCLCGRAAASGELLTSDSCFTDARHERTFTDMTAHGHYIIPLKSRERLVGVMFLYTSINPSWYKHSQEVLLSIGGLVGDAVVRLQNEEQIRTHRRALEQEVTERKQIEQELMKYRDQLEDQVEKRTEQLRDLSNRLQTIREEEKARIAREVHDELGQSLTALKLDLAWVERRLHEPEEAVREKIKSLYDLIESTIERVQIISAELRPRILDVLGVCEALRWQTGEFQERTGIMCELTIRPDALVLDPERSTTLFRIYQEALTNVARHAEASRIDVRCEQFSDRVELEVIDNGQGIDEKKVSDSHSLGLAGMRERALVWGGDVHIAGQPDRGTRLFVRIPTAST